MLDERWMDESGLRCRGCKRIIATQGANWSRHTRWARQHPDRDGWEVRYPPSKKTQLAFETMDDKPLGQNLSDNQAIDIIYHQRRLFFAELDIRME